MALIELSVLCADAEALERLAAQIAIPVVVLNTAQTTEDITNVVELPCAMGYLVKPFGEAAIDGAIRSAMAVSTRIRTLEKRLSDFQRSHADRDFIEQAKVVLIHRMDLTEARRIGTFNGLPVLAM